MSQVDDHMFEITLASYETGVNSNLIKAIMYMETTHGYYDRIISWFGANKSILPMNINYWGNTFGSRAALSQPYFNVRSGATMLKSIQANMSANSSIAQIATVYNNVNATKVSNYGARVSNIYHHKLWKQ